jgi:hypothetical protein
MEAARAERMRQNGHGTLTLEDARTWIEETGLCLFLPKRQFSPSVAPSFVEAMAGKRDATPDPQYIAAAEEMLVRLELDGVAVRLNLLGQPGEQPDYVVAGWVLPYVYALRGDRDWRRNPQLTGSRQVSPLAVQAYKLLEAGDQDLSHLTHALGREVTEAAVLRAITELWQQLRIIPVIQAPGKTAEWQLLRQRFQKAIAEGASTSQVTAISVLASIYLQAVIAATMEEVEAFLSPLTARSKVREVLRGLVATRQVHTITLGHSPHFYVAGTLPEYTVVPTLFANSSLPASAYFMREEEEDGEEVEVAEAVSEQPVAELPREEAKVVENAAAHSSTPRKPAVASKSPAARPHFSRPAPHSRDRKPAQSASGSRPARRPGSDARPAGSGAGSSSRPATGARWNQNAPTTANDRRGSARPGAVSGGNGSGDASGGAKAPTLGWNQRGGHASSSAAPGKTNSVARPRTSARPGNAARPDARPGTDARTGHSSSRTPALAAGTKTGNNKRFGFKARPSQGTKKRG